MSSPIVFKYYKAFGYIGLKLETWARLKEIKKKKTIS